MVAGSFEKQDREQGEGQASECEELRGWLSRRAVLEAEWVKSGGVFGGLKRALLGGESLKQKL